MANPLQHPVPPRLLVHIGDITVSFALLEQSLQMLIGSLITDHQRIGQIITAELAFRNLRALAISLYKERHGEDADYRTLRALMNHAGKLEEKRNQLTHSIWAAGKTKETIARVKMTAKEKHGFRSTLQEVGEAYLSAIATELKELAGDVLGFMLGLLEKGKVVNCPVVKPKGSDAEET